MPKKPLPQFVAPMQASIAKELFDNPDWIFETKLDGYRAIAVIDSAGKVRIWSRNRLPLEPKFPTVRSAVEELRLRSTILDGEIVALDEEGIPRFQLLRKWQKRPTAPVAYVLFDLLWDNGHDLTGKSVLQRRERLQEIIHSSSWNSSGGLRREAWSRAFPTREGEMLRGPDFEVAAKSRQKITQLAVRGFPLRSFFPVQPACRQAVANNRAVCGRA